MLIEELPLHPSLSIVCVATKSAGYYPSLLASAARYDYKLITLMMGEKWSGYKCKLQSMIKYLRDCTDDYILFVDAYDTLLLKDPKSIVEQYQNLCPQNNKIWVGVERLRGIKRWSAAVKMGVCNKQLLNSGVYFGPTKLTQRILEDCQNEDLIGKDVVNIGDDQQCLTCVCQKDTDSFLLDTSFILTNVCVNTNDREKFVIDGQKVIYNIDGKEYSPAVAHYVGNGSMYNLIRALGYDVEQYNQFGRERTFWSYTMTSYWHHTVIQTKGILSFLYQHNVILFTIFAIFCILLFKALQSNK